MAPNKTSDSSPGDTPTSPNAYDAQGRKSGAWTEPDPNGGVMVGLYRDGERHGTWRHLARDGRLRSEGPYEQGKLHGTWTWYRASGLLLQRGTFDHDVKHGRWERWDAQGHKLDSGEFDQGRKSGDWITYDSAGNVKTVKQFKPKQ